MSIKALDLHSRLDKLGVDAILVNTSDAVVSRNVRMLSGFSGSDATVLITRTERHLLTDGRYKIQATQQAVGFNVHVVRNKVDALARLMAASGVRRLGIESQRISYEFVSSLSRKLEGLEPVPLRQFLEGLRLTKTEDEVAQIREAAGIAGHACKETIEQGLAGKAESEVASCLDMLSRRAGSEKPAFDTIVASGPRSALPHGCASAKLIGPGELVIIDYGSRLNGYHSDETVTCITGAPNVEQIRMHAAVYDALMKVTDKLRPGLHVRTADAIARDALRQAGYEKYFVHGLGHGVGLEVHEPPTLSSRGRGVLDVGMVFTVEPGVYVEGIGGVRLESLIHLTKDGPEILSPMPKDLIRVD